ncbi:Bifunctional adenosylcobalamin biosynthesis protein CobP [Pelagimonas phthalicica]|uniref:Bifunctional adenosylcobalamin biosynthesis protein n=1 Tax=Pelagimonas phthalicica TaxID=1037362 RepID=A0A238JED9_9RHOB|nr:bifunctional adenosylcobinamide kinase/adenosylcobinamide-phosphate guanylyltransferase [Pelagimonas phthalicica]TDS91294.1 adenosylcobinamide kinase /adenosylcobinamide-phosphate guanylyltransferase [Pelagimonas phthalicica]SMX28342.1 Bifunctional adenosylcobalamin biosynthesis protein CobP [Pelagimonas phthalicica]
MSKSILITGGARSGKSVIAERITERLAAEIQLPPVYIATAQAFDAEMEDRIALHQERRGPEWRTVAEPLNVGQALRDTDGQGPRLLDCLTLWVSNMMHHEREIEAEARALAQAITTQTAPVVLVTNEVGGGIVPENALARRFRDEAGRVNQIIAQACEELYLAVAGYPLKVKPNDIEI